jgi:hypothetical protein
MRCHWVATTKQKVISRRPSFDPVSGIPTIRAEANCFLQNGADTVNNQLEGIPMQLNIRSGLCSPRSAYRKSRQSESTKEIPFPVRLRPAQNTSQSHSALKASAGSTLAARRAGT